MNETIFLQSAIQQFTDYKQLAEKTFAQLQDDDFHYRPNEMTNSIAIIITHLHGNMVSRWTNFLTEDGEKEWRQRDEEFEPHSYSREELLRLWEQGWAAVFKALEALQPPDFGKTVYIRRQPLSIIDAIHRQLTHYAGHTGQIILLGKIIKNTGWQSLSIPKSESKKYNDEMPEK